MAIQRSNNPMSVGKLIEMAETEYMVRGLGYIQSIADLQKASRSGWTTRGTPVRFKDVANVHLGPELRRGLVELNGEGESRRRHRHHALRRERARSTIQRVRDKLDELASRVCPRA